MIACNLVCEKSGGEHLAHALSEYGVTHVFMVPTVAVPALAAMSRLGVVGVMTHSEAAAAYMADGYARAAGRPGVCMAQSVGAANLAAGLRDASLMGTPVLAVTGGRAPETVHRHLYQEIDDFQMFAPLVKFNAEVDDAGRVPDLLRQAFRVATTGAPGPVHLRLRGRGGQVLDEPTSSDPGPLAEPAFSAVPPFRPVPGDEELRAALDLLASAERPVIVAGGGARVSGAQAELLELADAARHSRGNVVDRQGAGRRAARARARVPGQHVAAIGEPSDGGCRRRARRRQPPRQPGHRQLSASGAGDTRRAARPRSRGARSQRPKPRGAARRRARRRSAG